MIDLKKRTLVGSSALCALVSVLPACGPDARGANEEPITKPDDVQGVQQAVLESTCWTSTVLDDASITASGGAHLYSVASPDASYNHTTCPSQYIVDVFGISGKGFQVDAAPTGQPSANQDWCSGFWGLTKVKGWTGGQWVDVDYWQETGRYYWPIIAGNFCHESVTAGQAPRYHAANHGFSMLRIVTQGGFAASLQPVSVSIQVGL